MKKSILVIITLLLSVSTFAQDNSQVQYIPTMDYNRFAISYEYDTQVPKTGDDFHSNGFGLEYVHGFSLSKTYPIFIETGAKFTYSMKTMDGKDIFDDEGRSLIELKYNMSTIKVPVSISYKIIPTNSSVEIVPFIGLNCKYHLSGTCEIEDADITDNYEFDDVKCDLFDKDDMGNRDNTYNRLQLGWQIGVGLRCNILYLGLGYGSDFTDIVKKVTSSNFYATVGFHF